MLKIKARNWAAQSAFFPELGSGGEAKILKMKEGVVAKVFLKPNAEEYKSDKSLQEAARVRLEEMQKKLSLFPKDLPKGFITPTGVLVDAKNRVFGYIMPFAEGVSLDKLCKTNASVQPSQIVSILENLYDLVSALHECDVVIGDFNENNVIVNGVMPQLVDTDSAQFGEFQCKTFMPHFTAPELLVGPKAELEKKAQEQESKEPDPEPTPKVKVNVHAVILSHKLCFCGCGEKTAPANSFWCKGCAAFHPKPEKKLRAKQVAKKPVAMLVLPKVVDPHAVKLHRPNCSCGDLNCRSRPMTPPDSIWCPQCRAFHPDLGLIVEKAQTIISIHDNKVMKPLSLIAPHSKEGDWYSFMVLAMRLIAHVGPYSGVSDTLDLRERMEQRVTVFEKEKVRYPMNARPLEEIPRELLVPFFKAFHRDMRFVPEKGIFGALNTKVTKQKR